jgi:exosome complex RNA-binding protein Csl4
MNREVYKEVKTYEVQMTCNKCEFGSMKPTGRSFMTYPQQYEHKCNQCDNIETFKITYPYIKYS